MLLAAWLLIKLENYHYVTSQKVENCGNLTFWFSKFEVGSVFKKP